MELPSSLIEGLLEAVQYVQTPSILTMFSSKRMYEERFKKWGVHKYSKKKEKEVIDPQTQFSPDLEITEDYGWRDSRHMQGMHRKNAVDLQALYSRATGKYFINRMGRTPCLITLITTNEQVPKPLPQPSVQF